MPAEPAAKTDKYVEPPYSIWLAPPSKEYQTQGEIRFDFADDFHVMIPLSADPNTLAVALAGAASTISQHFSGKKGKKG